MLHAARVERRAPGAAVVARELKIGILPGHAHHDVADAAPGVEPAVHQLQLGRRRRQEREAEGGDESGAALRSVGGHLVSALVTRRRSTIVHSVRMSTGFTRYSWKPAWRTACRWKSSSYARSEEHTSELQSPCNLVCRLLLEKKKKTHQYSLHTERQ